MTTHDSIRHLLKQAHDEANSQLEAGKVPENNRDAVQAFRDDLGRLVERMDPVRLSAPDGATLGRDLFELMRRCQGPLQHYRHFFEDAISVTKTEVE